MYNQRIVKAFRNTILGIVLGALAATGPARGQAAAGDPTAVARAAVKKAWDKEVGPYSESSLNRIQVHAVERRNRLARDVYLVHAFAEASFWKHSEHYLLLLRPGASGFEVLYRFAGGAGGKGIEYRLVDLGSPSRRFALEISDHGVDDDSGDATTSTWTILVMHLPESDSFAEVFRQLTTYRPPSALGYSSRLSFRPAEGPIKEIVARTELLKGRTVVERVESVFAWQETAYQGLMPLPDAWRAELPARIKRRATGN